MPQQLVVLSGNIWLILDLLKRFLKKHKWKVDGFAISTNVMGMFASLCGKLLMCWVTQTML